MTEHVETTAQEAQDPANAGQEKQAPDLTINDLKAIQTIIDVSCQRGTFKAAEMASVGQVYNRLLAFLDHVAPQATQNPAEAPKQ